MNFPDWNTARRAGISSLMGELGYEWRAWLAKVGRWGNAFQNLLVKGGWMRRCKHPQKTAGIISQEQQWRPCLCPAPDGISFGISFHLEQPPQENDPNSCTALGAVSPSHWYQPHLWFHLFHDKCYFNSAEQFRAAAKMEFFTVPPSPDLAVPSLPFSHTVSEVCSM